MINQGQELKQLTKEEKINLSTIEIAKKIREQLKQEFKDCKFSIVSEYYSMGSSITISLMECNFKVIRDINNISESAIFRLSESYTKEQIQELQKQTDYYSVNFSFHIQLGKWDKPLKEVV